MSSKAFATPTAHWATNRTRDEVVGELTRIEQQLSEALAGRLFLPEAQRLELEDRRRALTKELRQIEATEFHADTDGPEEAEATQTLYPVAEARRRWLARNKGKAVGAKNCGEEEAQLRAQVTAMTQRVQENEAQLTDLKQKLAALGYRLPGDQSQRLEFLGPAGNLLVVNRPHGEGSFVLPRSPEASN